MHDHPGLILALIGLSGILAQWLSWWLKLPAILFLLLLGILAGPVTGVVRPDELFGDLLFPLVSLGVAVILFEGSLTLRFHEIRGSLEGAVGNLVSVGALLNWGMISFAAAWLMDFSWDIALLFGALVTVTGPTVIVPMLRSVRPRKRVADTLRWEGIIIDPVGALLAVLVFEAISVGTDENTFEVFALSVGIGASAGALGAWVLGQLLRRHWLPEYLHNVGALTLVLAIFTASNTLQEESGLLAVTVMGIMLANMKVPTEDILDFKESLSVLLISGLFIILAARMDFAQFQALDWNALYLLGAIAFVARPVAVFVATIGSGLNWREKTLISWIGPRGIVAAAITPLFVLKIDPAYYHHTELLVPLVFMIIIGTVVLQSFTARPLARLLKVIEPDPRGVLIVGANPVARAVARALAAHGYYSLLADTNWSQLRAARMDGLKTYFGNPVSAHADRHLDLVGLGRLFAMSRHPALNALACIRYQREFGTKNVFTF
ncbi:MAG: sodium:proton antiporter, partial [Candidatus Competibacteraceae bacterium]|nr:sodium:proton antiporter [Candidatus Competibacteraceae bacterium]